MDVEVVAMIVKTRYRDIPWEEVIKCIVGPADPATRKWWEGRRGADVAIEAPAASNITREDWACDGPWFDIVSERHCLRGTPIAACPHIAEIGD